MKPLMTLEEAVSEYNTANPKTPLSRELKIPTLSFKVTQSDNGEIIDPDSWETCIVTFKIYPEERYSGSFLTVRRSKQVHRGFELVILHHEFIDWEHGFCVGQVDMTSESEGIEIARSGTKKISAEEAAQLLNGKNVWLRERNGTQLRMPSVSTFKL